jgi:hypothetical protein
VEEKKVEEIPEAAQNQEFDFNAFDNVEVHVGPEPQTTRATDDFFNFNNG